jgi:flavin-dependent dehydrogenase
VTVRATSRGAQRTSLEGTRAEVLICGASFAGLAVARELASSGASVLVVDRYEIGERQTSACACPTLWLEALGLSSSIKQELPYMTFTTPQGTARYRLPWSWSSFDYRQLCELLWAQCGEARFETAKVESLGERRADGTIEVITDRGTISAPLVVDALGWRRVLSSPHYQPPEAPLSRGLEVHPEHDGSGDALEVWVERSIVRRGYGWRVPAADEARIGVGSYDPIQHVKEPTVALSQRLGRDPVNYQGNWFPHRLRAATEGDIFFAGDSAGHCFPLSGEGIRTAFYFGIACGRELRRVIDGSSDRAAALAAYESFNSSHKRPFAIALALQRLIPALPPRLLTALLAIIGNQRIIDKAFGWYLDQAAPEFAAVNPRNEATKVDDPNVLAGVSR